MIRANYFSENELHIILYKTKLSISYQYRDQKENEKLADAVVENHRILWGDVKRTFYDKIGLYLNQGKKFIL